MFKRLAVGLLAGAVLAFGASAWAAVVTVVPAAQSVVVGAQAQVDIVVSDLGSGSPPSLGTYDIDVSFEPALLGLMGVVFGNGLDVNGLGSLQVVTAGAGTVNLFELSFDLPTELDSLQGATFTLATLTFESLAAGTSLIGLSINAFGDALGDPISFTTLSGSILSGSIAVTEPSSALLLSIALLALVGRRGRKVAASGRSQNTADLVD